MKELSLSSQNSNKTNEGELTLDVKLVLEDNLFSRSESVVRVLSSFALMTLKGKIALLFFFFFFFFGGGG